LNTETPKKFFSITLPGAMIAHKNMWMRSKHGMRLPDEAKDYMATCAMIARAAWSHGAPARHPRMTVEFHVKSGRIDRDGMFVTVNDILQKAGVIQNDNVKHFNGELTILPAVVDKANPHTVIRLWFIQRDLSTPKSAAWTKKP